MVGKESEEKASGKGPFGLRLFSRPVGRVAQRVLFSAAKFMGESDGVG